MEGENPDVVKLSVYSEANVNAEPAYSCGRKALQGAAKNGGLVVMKLSLNHRASNHVSGAILTV